jgi:predicted RND superfamily exporter protein
MYNIYLFHLYFSQFALKRKFIPTFLTVITTAIGFGSLIVSDIVVIRDFAIVVLSYI